MSFALSAGVTGLQAHQKMLDVAGNNLANVNTTGFKSSSIHFAELLSQTIKKASQPTSNVGGTNPQQLGSGVGIASISNNMSQGNIKQTGNSLDLAIDGEGYFVLSDGSQLIYSRAGAFAVDENSTLVDPATGYRVQRIGSVGEADDFQIPSESTIHIPYDRTMPAQATSEIVISGNLSSDASTDSPAIQKLDSNISYTVSETAAALSTELDALDQYSGTLTTGTLTFAGYDKDGTDLAGAGLTMAVTGTTTLGNVVDHLNNNLLTDSTASLVNGKIRVTDDAGGYSKTDLSMSYAGDGTLDMPAYFEYITVGGTEVKSINITTYDSQGGAHTLSAAFTRSDTANSWDMILTSISGDINDIDLDARRVNGIGFEASDGTYAGLTGSDTLDFTVTFDHDTATAQTISLNLGTIGELDGITQFAGTSTAVARDQDGYSSGRLSTVSVNNEGTVVGAFSNGVKKDIAQIQIGLFQNAAGLEAVGGGYFIPSANSGEAVATQAMTGGAGTMHGGSLEGSNADVATEFVNMIQAQNGYQANARTITVANEILQELSNLIR